MRPETTAALAAGRQLFNERRYFEAHEAWEDAWRVEEGEVRALLQALILVAAGCHKATVGEPRGTVKLLTAALEKLAHFPDGEAGLALGAFRQAVTEAQAGAAHWNAGGPAISPTFPLSPRERVGVRADTPLTDPDPP